MDASAATSLCPPCAGGISSALIARARQAAAAILAELDGVEAVLLATAAGTPVAKVGRSSVDDTMLTVAACAMANASEVIAGNAAIGALRCLFVEAADGRALVRRLTLDGAPLVALLFADKALPFGLAASRIGQIELAMGPD